MEGVDDERFFNKIIKVELSKKYSRVKVYQYAQTTRRNLEKFIDSLKKSGCAYIFFTDLDMIRCYTRRKEQIKSKTAKNIDNERIAVVRTEIESWYLAGLDQNNTSILGIQYFSNTDEITKEIFAQIHKKYSSRIDFMTTVLENFSIDIAKTQNDSFRYFCDKFL